jgi:hypothetical protein
MIPPLPAWPQPPARCTLAASNFYSWRTTRDPRPDPVCESRPLSAHAELQNPAGQELMLPIWTSQPPVLMVLKTAPRAPAMGRSTA